MITVDADGLIIAVILFGGLCMIAGYGIGYTNALGKRVKDSK